MVPSRRVDAALVSRGSRRSPLAVAGVLVTALAVAPVAVGASAATTRSSPPWVISTTLDPETSSNQLIDVSCTSPTFCEAVGYASDSVGSDALLEEWNGTSWRVQTAPLIPDSGGPGDEDVELAGVSCSSPTDCTASGWYGNLLHGSETLIEEWNGTSWRFVSTPNIPWVSAESILYGISCTTSGSCTAVGSVDGKPTQSAPYTTSAIAIVGRSGSWKAELLPGKRTGDTSMYDVSCTKGGFCATVGWYTDTSGFYRTTSDVEVRGVWRVEKTASNGISQLFGIACTSASFCAAGGYWHNNLEPLIERWNGRAWSVERTPDPGKGYATIGFNSLRCTSSSACVAAGSFGNPALPGTPTDTLVEAWNGKVWSVEPTPNPSGSDDSELWGVSCVRAGTCVAVGFTYSSTGILTLGEKR